jgi:hypothetical protein
MRDIFRIKVAQVACPECGAAPRTSCLSPMGNRLTGYQGRSTFHKPRAALARRVSSILLAHFDVKEVPCSGEAHRPEVGGMIDNCMVCAPRWGTVERLVPKEVIS